MTLYTSAVASKFPNGLKTNSNAIKLLATDFRSGVYLDTVQMLGPAGSYTQGRSYLRGTDSKTGYTMDTALQGYMGSQVELFVQQLLASTDHVADSTELATNFTVALQTTGLSLDPAAKELYIKLLKRNVDPAVYGNPLAPFLAQRNRDDFATTNAIPIKPIPSIYWKFDCTLDPNLANLLSNSADYMDLVSVKDGDLNTLAGSASPGVGTYRFSALIQKNASGQLYIACRCDNVANGIGIVPTGYGSETGFYFAPFTLSSQQINVGDTVRGRSSLTTGTIGFVRLHPGYTWGSNGKGVLVINNNGAAFNNGEVLQVQVAGVWTDACTVANFWNGYESQQLSIDEQKYLYNAGAVNNVPLGIPLRFELRIVRPIGGRTDITTGVTQLVMTNLITNERVVLCDFRGGIQMGAGNPPLARIFFMTPYTSYNSTAFGGGDHTTNVAQRFTNFEVWTDAPWPIV